MQLVAYGAQDIYITGNPQITFFKVVYRRHTNFAIESIEQTFNGTVGLGKKVSATISRNGDLITDCWLEVTLTKSGSTWFPTEELLSTVELEIGGQRIDKHYSDWYRMYSEIFRRHDEKDQYRRMVDFVDGESSALSAVKRMYFPLIFFFNKNPGLALPLIALQYHEVKLNFELKSSVTGVSALGTFQLFVDYVYLDTEERRRFAQVSHEYLIEQLQFTGDESITISTSTNNSQNIRLNYNHPVKALFWACYNTVGQFGVYSGDGTSTYNVTNPSAVSQALVAAEAFAPINDVKLQLNGHDRFATRKGSYFNLVQPYQTVKSYPQAGVYMYSFALKPQEHQPSGTCNFSRIDNATLNLSFKKATAGILANVGQVITETATCAAAAGALNAIKIFAVNYNVLRIMSGMGGLALLLYIEIARKSHTPRGSGISSWTTSFVPPAVFVH